MDLSKVEWIFYRAEGGLGPGKGAICLMILLASVPVAVLQPAWRLSPLLGPSQELHHPLEFYKTLIQQWYICDIFLAFYTIFLSRVLKYIYNYTQNYRIWLLRILDTFLGRTLTHSIFVIFVFTLYRLEVRPSTI